eukprot:COSAG01_NODE_52373_length_347_cov_0.629032_1_plen_27_part_10
MVWSQWAMELFALCLLPVSLWVGSFFT